MRNFFLILLALSALAVGIGACSGDDKRADPGGYGGDSGYGGGQAGTCDPGQQRACGFKVDQGEGVVTCFMGTQTCAVDGTWGECKNGDFVEMPDDKERNSQDGHGWFKPLVLTSQSPVECNPKDPCDPNCWEVPEPSPTFTDGTDLRESVLCEVGDPTPVTECSAGPGCSHSLCTTGAAGLSSSLCGSCATKVCAALPGCCNTASPTAWDSTCLAKAFELCLNAPPPIGLCEFGIFSETTLVMADRPGMGNGTIGALGNLEFGTDSTGKFPNKLIVTGDVWIRSPGTGTATFAGGIWATGSVGFQAGATTWSGNLRSGEGVYINGGGNKFTGLVYTSSDYNNSISGSDSPKSFNISGQSGGSITGTGYASSTAEIDTPTSGFAVTTKAVNPFPPLTASSIVAPTAVPPLPAPCASGTCPGGANQSRTSAGDLTLTPGNYGTVTLQNGARLVLNGAGTYSMKSLTMEGSGGLKLATTGTYNLVVEGAMKFGYNGSNAKVVDAANATLTDPTRLLTFVGSNASPAFELGNTAIFTGVLSVPNGSFKSNNTGSVNGAVWAAGFTTGPDFTLTQIGKTACEGLSLGGTTPPTPPTATCTTLDGGATLSVPAIPSSEVLPCRWGADCQSNQRCTNVDSRVGSTPCSQFHKCTATGTMWGGPAALPCKDDPCVARIIANHSNCGTNWDLTCVGYVQTECDATCGACSTNCLPSSPERSGVCVSNEGYANETGCAGYDLALGYACRPNQVPVCNHGSTQFSGSVKVGYWSMTDRQFATLPAASPNTTTMDGSCTQTLTIPAGSCTNMTNCAFPSTASVTLMVDPDGTLSECGLAGTAKTNRRMDNWSWFDKDYMCVSNPDYTQYEYVADCPDDQYASWKYLKWVTDNNNAPSNVKFYAKVAKDIASLGAQSYQLLATNTADCTEANANALTSTCAVGLTSALSLTSPQGQALSVRVEKTNDPIVTKWEVSYTCDYDQ